MTDASLSICTFRTEGENMIIRFNQVLGKYETIKDERYKAIEDSKGMLNEYLHFIKYEVNDDNYHRGYRFGINFFYFFFSWFLQYYPFLHECLTPYELNEHPEVLISRIYRNLHVSKRHAYTYSIIHVFSSRQDERFVHALVM